MKKIIKGRKYDTETAKLVGEWSNDHYATDFAFCAENLYRKKTGEYFLHGRGNAASKYAKSVGDNTWSGGSEIIPLSYDSAREWAEEHLDADEYESEFGEVDEDEVEDMTTVTVRVSVATKSALDRLAAKTGRSKGDILAEAIGMVQ